MGQRRSRSNGRETMASILKVAREELDEHGPVKFNILRVIEKTGVSRSSLYHHFGGRDGLIAAVEVDRLVHEFQLSNEFLRVAIVACTSGEQAFKILEQVLVIASSPEGRQARAHRIAVIATAQNISSLRQALLEQFERSDYFLAGTLEIARDMGLLTTAKPMLPIARMISTLFVGRIVVDGLESEDSDREWIEMTLQILRFLLGPT